MPGRTLMIQGTSSSVGKSLLAAGLCRLFARRGRRVAPFKAQNMSNNAAVCADGAEIGRAQAVQAVAAGIAPTSDMNPVLLKPEADARSQVIVLGKPWATLQAGSYYRRKEQLWPVVTAALHRLRRDYELVIIEGAGSPAELNLRAFDIVNMAIARHAGSPVLLAGDIDRGGIFAQLLGTLWLLPDDERRLVQGFIVNKFRGDIALFRDGVRILEERGGVPVLGVVPYMKHLAIPEEDAVVLDSLNEKPTPEMERAIDIAVIRLPQIANFDDFDPLRAEPGVRVRYVDNAATLGEPHAVILPGTKSTIADLAWLRQQGLADPIRRLAGAGAAVVGICGGFQMLGKTISDPVQVESRVLAAEGLGLLPIETIFSDSKVTHQVEARLHDGPGWLRNVAERTLTGYEIHMGRSQGGWPLLEITRRSDMAMSQADGAVTEDGRIWGCCLHGLFGNAGLRRTWLASLKSLPERPVDAAPRLDLHAALDRLADELEKTLDISRLERIIEGSVDGDSVPALGEQK